MYSFQIDRLLNEIINCCKKSQKNPQKRIILRYYFKRIHPTVHDQRTIHRGGCWWSSWRLRPANSLSSDSPVGNSSFCCCLNTPTWSIMGIGSKILLRICTTTSYVFGKAEVGLIVVVACCCRLYWGCVAALPYYLHNELSFENILQKKYLYSR